MTLSGEHVELFRGLRPAGRFAEEPSPQRQCLIRTDDISARAPRRHEKGFLARQKGCDVARCRKVGGLLDRPFIDFGRHGFEIEPALAKSICRARLCDASINGAFPRHTVILPTGAAVCR